MRVTARMRALSAQLMQALESGQDELAGTLLAERQQLIASLSSENIPSEERQALREVDDALCRLVQEVCDQIARELQTNHQLQRLQAQIIPSQAPPASFLDQFG